MPGGVFRLPAGRGAWAARAGALALAVLLGCDDGGNTVEVTDSEGRVFSARCDEESGCRVEQLSGPTWPDPAKPDLIFTTAGRVLGVCNAPAGADRPQSPGDCRALSCSSDAECPSPYGLEEGTCFGGVCTDESHGLVAADAVMLCLWGLGLGRDGPERVERFAMGHNCGKPCEIPEPCHQL